jgi:hypothetical protein
MVNSKELLEEAKRRYPLGSYFTCVASIKSGRVRVNDYYYCSDDSTIYSECDGGGGGGLYRKGNWAIPEINNYYIW